LAALCPQLSDVPTPLIDPERALWEVDTVGKYGECAGRHRNLGEAWRKAIKPGGK
jgi:hypothetical protein